MSPRGRYCKIKWMFLVCTCAGIVQDRTFRVCICLGHLIVWGGDLVMWTRLLRSSSNMLRQGHMHELP